MPNSRNPSGMPYHCGTGSDIDTIRKKIVNNGDAYQEQELNGKIMENRTVLLPKTTKGTNISRMSKNECFMPMCFFISTVSPIYSPCPPGMIANSEAEICLCISIACSNVITSLSPIMIKHPATKLGKGDNLRGRKRQETVPCRSGLAFFGAFCLAAPLLLLRHFRLSVPCVRLRIYQFPQMAIGIGNVSDVPAGRFIHRCFA